MLARSLILVAALAIVFGLASLSGAQAKSKRDSAGGKGAASSAGSAGSVQTRSQTGKAKPAMKDMVITKPVDKSSPK